MRTFLLGFVLGTTLLGIGGASAQYYGERDHLLREQNQILRDLRDQELRRDLFRGPCP